MMDDFDVFASSSNGGSKTASSAIAGEGGGGTADLLGHESNGDATGMGAMGSDFHECNINEDDTDDDEEEVDIIEENDGAPVQDGGDNLLDLDGGWNLRSHRSDNDAATTTNTNPNGASMGLSNNAGMWGYALNNDGGQSRQQLNTTNNGDVAPAAERTVYKSVVGAADRDNEEYGINDDAVNAKGKRNNSRGGLFSGWKSGRNNNNNNQGGDLLDDDSQTPSWSNMSKASATPAPSSSGGGFFGRSRASPKNNSDTTSSSYNQIPHDGIDAAALAQGEGGLTGDVDDHVNTIEEDTEIFNKEMEEERQMDNDLRPGDHIYVWQSYGINPRAYQRHAVVYSVTPAGEAEQVNANMTTLSDYHQSSSALSSEPPSFDTSTLYNDTQAMQVTVVSFYHFQRHAAHGAALAANAASGSRRGKRSGCKRELLHDFLGPDAISKKKPIHKVRYGRQVKKGLLSTKASVGTALKKDAVGLILARVRYLLENQSHLPDHNALSANGECAAMWCVTGRWCTLQGASILQITSVGQAGGALLAGGILSNITILVPMPGLWGAAGWWWYVPTTVAYPFLVPMLVAFGMASLVPLEILRRNRKKWRGITDGLNHEFWVNADEDIKEKYFGLMVTAEKEAEMRSFFGAREGDTAADADDSRYMPLGGAPDGMGDDDEEEDEVMAMQNLERSCANMDVDLSGKPPARENSGGGGLSKFMGSFRRKESGTGSQSLRDMQKQGDWEISEKEREIILS